MKTASAISPVSQTRKRQRQEREKGLQEFVEEVKRNVRRDEKTYGALASELRAVFIFALSNRLAFPDRPLEIEDVRPKASSYTFEQAKSREWSYRSFCDMSLSATCGRFSKDEATLIFAELLAWLVDDICEVYRSAL